jgi:hypothetical protein
MRTRFPAFAVLGAIVLLLVALVAGCGATDAGRLDAAATWPLVDRLTQRQGAYVEAGILPDGSPMSVATQHVQRTSLVVLRNAWHAALGRPLEPLPAPPEVAPQ